MYTALAWLVDWAKAISSDSLWMWGYVRLRRVCVCECAPRANHVHNYSRSSLLSHLPLFFLWLRARLRLHTYFGSKIVHVLPPQHSRITIRWNAISLASNRYCWKRSHHPLGSRSMSHWFVPIFRDLGSRIRNNSLNYIITRNETITKWHHLDRWLLGLLHRQRHPHIIFSGIRRN